jgi:hypothetical protein
LSWAHSHFYQGTPIFISRAVEQGKPVPLNNPCHLLAAVPEIPECYANAHSERNEDFPEEFVNLRDLENRSQDDEWRHELDHDVESVFWLLLYWAMVVQPAKTPRGYINSHIDSSSWSSLLGDFKARQGLVSGLSSYDMDMPTNLIHSVYEPLWPLIKSLAAILVVDRHWLPKSSARKRPEYMCEAFQRLILRFIISERDKYFMTCRVGASLRREQSVAQSQALSTTPSQQRDMSERETSGIGRLYRIEVSCICGIFKFLSFLLLCSQDADQDESSAMIA